MSIENGTYTAKAVQWDWGFTKGSHDRPSQEQIAVQFEITEGPYAGQCVVWYGFFSEKAQARTLESLRYCGWKNDDIMTMEGMGDYLVQIVVEEEIQTEGKNAGNKYPRVRWVNKLGGGGPIKLERPMDMSQKRMFAARMKMLAKTVPPVKGGYPATRAETERPGEGKDDIPF